MFSTPYGVSIMPDVTTVLVSAAGSAIASKGQKVIDVVWNDLIKQKTSNPIEAACLLDNADPVKQNLKKLAQEDKCNLTIYLITGQKIETTQIVNIDFGGFKVCEIYQPEGAQIVRTHFIRYEAVACLEVLDHFHEESSE